MTDPEIVVVSIAGATDHSGLQFIIKARLAHFEAIHAATVDLVACQMRLTQAYQRLAVISARETTD